MLCGTAVTIMAGSLYQHDFSDHHPPRFLPMSAGRMAPAVHRRTVTAVSCGFPVLTADEIVTCPPPGRPYAKPRSQGDPDLALRADGQVTSRAASCQALALM